MIKFYTVRCVLAAAAAVMLAQVAGASMAEHTERATIAGIDVITYHSDVKDVVEVIGYLPAGEAMAGEGNAAVATLTGIMLDRGTRAQDKFAIARQLEEVGAQITYNVGRQTLQVQAKSLKKDLALVIGTIAAELRTPAFAAQEFAKVKHEYIGGLENQLHSTDTRAHQAFSRALFAPGHPNRNPSTEEQLEVAKRATLADVKAFHAKNYGPQHLTLVLVGDISMAAAQDEIERAFKGWSGGVDFQRSGPPAVAATGALVPVEIKDKTSVSVLLGQTTGLRYRDPDTLALRVGTAILGNGFTGRLMTNIRDRQGLTYGIGAGVSDDNLADGTWQISATFAPSLLGKGVEATRKVLEDWWQTGVTDKELEERKQGLVGSYLVGLSTTAGIATAIVNLVQRGYELSWLDQYPDAVRALTREQVNTAIHTHLNPATMALVEAGSLPAAAAAAATAVK